jgi:hypothetical protein
VIVESRGNVLIGDAMETILPQMIFQRVLEGDGIEINSVPNGLMKGGVKDHDVREAWVDFFAGQYSSEIVRVMKPRESIRSK